MKKRKCYKCECGKRTSSRDGVCLDCSDISKGLKDSDSGTPIKPYWENDPGSVICGYPAKLKLTSQERYNGEVYRDDI